MLDRSGIYEYVYIATAAMVVARAPPPVGALQFVHSLCTSHAQFAHRLRRLCVRRHTFTTHSATVIRSGSCPLWRSVALLSLPMVIHIPENHFIAPVCHQSLPVSSNSLCPLCVLSDPIGHGRA